MTGMFKKLTNNKIFQFEEINRSEDAFSIEYGYKILFLKMILFAAIPFASYYFILAIIHQHYIESVFNFACFISITFGLLVLVRRPRNHIFGPVISSIPIVYFVSLALAHFSSIGYRGLINYLPWIFIFPLFSSFVLSGKIKYYFIYSYVIIISLLLLFGSKVSISSDIIVSLKYNSIFVLVVICYASLFFEKARLKTQKVLVQKQLRLYESEQQYREANERLMREIGERGKVEEALRESEEQYRQLVNFAPAAIYEFDFATERFLSVNDLLCEYTGYSREEILQLSPLALLTEESQGLLRERLHKIQAGVKVDSNPVYEIVNKQGQRRWIMLNVNWSYENGRPVRAKVVAQDITELKHAQDALKKAHDELEIRVRERTAELEQANRELSDEIEERRKAQKALQDEKEKYRELVNHAPAGIYEVDFIKSRFVSVNDVICKYLGYTEEEMLSMNSLEILTDDSKRVFLERLHKIMAGKRVPEHVEFQIRKKNGDSLWVQLTARYITENGVLKGARVIAHNISEQKKAAEEKAKLQSQLQQAQKMEALGTLAGGIAHDFNNILSAIIGYTELAQTNTLPDSEIHDNLEAVLKAGKRARDLVSQILTFSRRAEQERAPAQLRVVVEEAVKLLRPSLPSTIDLRLSAQSDGFIMADASQLSQVVMNLCANAYQALPDNSGKIEVTLSDINVDAFSPLRPRLRPGSYMRLTVSDNGRGMSESLISRIFDPYFTTKDIGKGTGLGLAVVQGIVRSHDGIITVSSQLGKGSTFDVYLPRIEDYAEEGADLAPDIPGGNERVLLVDDEPALTMLGHQVLQGLGYQVTTCVRSKEALELFKANPGEFDIVITDMTMPGMTGAQLSEELLKIRPELPIILCTGFSEIMTQAKAVEIGIKAYMEKPLERRTLAKTIRDALNGLDYAESLGTGPREPKRSCDNRKR